MEHDGRKLGIEEKAFIMLKNDFEVNKMMLESLKEDFEKASNKLENCEKGSDLHDMLAQIYKESYDDLRAYKKKLIDKAS